MDEFDRIGRDNFLRKYGFGPSAGLLCPSRGEALRFESNRRRV
jgi:hypothetical protein